MRQHYCREESFDVKTEKKKEIEEMKKKWRK